MSEYDEFQTPARRDPTAFRGKSEAVAGATVETQKSLSRVLAEIEERANKATEGPWGLNWGSVLAHGITTTICQVPCGEVFDGDKWKRNRDFIASARTDVPALVKALRRAEQTFQFEINRGNAWSSINARDALREITAILNQGRTKEADLGEKDT